MARKIRHKKSKTNAKKINISTQQLLLQNLQELKKQNNFIRNFLLSVVSGLGNAIGATIIFGALLVYAKNKFKPQIHQIYKAIQEVVIIKK